MQVFVLAMTSSSLNSYLITFTFFFPGGYNFALRLVWILRYSREHFDYDYFLRIDDDHFLCLDRLLYELPFRKKSALIWGFIHCKPRIVRVDEGWLLMSADLVDEALSKYNTTLQCHPYGDQAVALWMIDSKYNVTYFSDNDRVIHEATSYHLEKYLRKDICILYLSLHGSYPETMKKYWSIIHNNSNSNSKQSNDNDSRPQKRLQYHIPPIKQFHEVCPFPEKDFDVNYFYPDLRFQPKPCKDEPIWRSASKVWSREEHGELD